MHAFGNLSVLEQVNSICQCEMEFQIVFASTSIHGRIHKENL